ncbi:MAG: PD-(D/E)XK nuclease family protein, partial [Opitutales bacterium]
MIIKIRPSTLSVFSTCPRCLWLNHRTKWREPLNLRLYSVLAAKEENFLHGKNTTEVMPALGEGTFRWKGEKVMSSPITGLDTPHDVFVGGSFDNVAQLVDGTVVVVDCKTTAGKTEGYVDKYVMQLNAYAYAIENPADPDFVAQARQGLKGDEGIGYFQKPTWSEKKTVSRIGLKIFSFEDPFGGRGEDFSIPMKGVFQEAEKDFDGFRERCQWLVD